MKIKKLDHVVDDISIKMMQYENGRHIVNDSEIINMIDTLRDVNVTDRDGRTLIIHAAFYDRNCLFDYLLKKGANLLIGDKKGITALHASVISDNYKMVKKILDLGVFADLTDNYGNTSLFYAKPSSKDIISLLVKSGSNPMHKNLFGVSAYDTFLAYSDVIDILKNCE